MIIKRRELLHLLSVAGGALFIPGIDWDHIEASLTRPSHIDITVVNDLETINNRSWSLFTHVMRNEIEANKRRSGEEFSMENRSLCVILRGC